MLLIIKHIFYQSARHSSHLLRLKVFGKVSFIITQLKLASCRYNQDSSCTCKEMNETGKIEDPADESNNQQTNFDADNLQDGENHEKAERKKIILSTDHCTYQLARTLSSPDCRDSKEASPKLSKLDLSKFMSKVIKHTSRYKKIHKIYIHFVIIKTFCHFIIVLNKLCLRKNSMYYN